MQIKQLRYSHDTALQQAAWSHSLDRVKMREIHEAVPSDADEIIAFDHVAQQEPRRVDFIHDAIQAGNCHVYRVGTSIVGYGVLEYSFFNQGFISMLYVHPEFRRRSIGEELMRYMERACKTAKIFTSTNRSNKPMQALLEELGYQRSGYIENLDEGDPELIYFKWANPQAN